MKDSYKLYKRCNRKILKIAEQIENIETLPYYTIFRREGEQERDLREAYDCMRDSLNEKQVHLENLIIEANKELNRVSQDLRTFTLKKQEHDL